MADNNRSTTGKEGKNWRRRERRRQQRSAEAAEARRVAPRASSPPWLTKAIENANRAAAEAAAANTVEQTRGFEFIGHDPNYEMIEEMSKQARASTGGRRKKRKPKKEKKTQKD